MFNVSKKSKNILAFVYVIGLLLFATIYSQSEQSRNRMPGQPQFLPTVIPSEMVMPTEPVPTPTPLPPEYEVPVLQTVNPHREANELPVSYIKDGEVWVSSFDGNYSEQVTFSNGHIGLHEWGESPNMLYVTFNHPLEENYADLTINQGLIEINLDTGNQKTIIEPIQDPRYFYHLCNGWIHYPSIEVLEISPDKSKLAISKSGILIYDFDNDSLDTIHELGNSYYMVEERRGLLSWLVKSAYAACWSDPVYRNFIWSDNSNKIIANFGNVEGSEVHMVTLSNSAFEVLRKYQQEGDYIVGLINNDRYVGNNINDRQVISYFLSDYNLNNKKEIWNNDNSQNMYFVGSSKNAVYLHTFNQLEGDYRNNSIYTYNVNNGDISLVASINGISSSSVLQISSFTQDTINNEEIIAFTSDHHDSSKGGDQVETQFINVESPSEKLIVKDVYNPRFR